MNKWFASIYPKWNSINSINSTDDVKNNIPNIISAIFSSWLPNDSIKFNSIKFRINEILIRVSRKRLRNRWLLAAEVIFLSFKIPTLVI